jgi:ubiquinone/menaquinone biosynthesis C-methylase UbiE
MKSSLLSGGEHYNLLVNWEKRIKNDIPFLLDLLRGVKSEIKTVLEVGCGTGRHAEVLQNKEGFILTGVDISESMIEEASKRVPDAEILNSDFMDPELLNNRKFDAIFSIGNSTGLIAQSYDFKLIIKRFYDFLRKSGGLLIFHLLNTEKERNGWSKPRTISIEEGEFLFLRGFSTDEKFVHPEILTLFKPKGESEWQMDTPGKANIPRINHKKMLAILKENGFKNIRVFGNFKKEVFDSENSVDMIFVANT